MPSLFEFQKYCVNFLVDKKSVLIGDDMGLGKTIEAIVLDLERRIKQPNIVKHPKTLVITYLSIFSGWKNHFAEWAPNLRVKVIDNKNRQPFIDAIANDEADVFILHWQAIRLMPELVDTNWFHIIGDEIHALQNRKSKQSIALKKIKAIYKTGLSGTPAYDKPDDLWSILNWLYPDFWSSYWKYFNEHILWVDYNGFRTVIGVAEAEKLQQQMSGFYIRRLKEQVLLDLPDKYYQTIEVDLDPKQFRAYEAMRRDMLAWVGEHENEPVAAPVVIAQITRLQQFASAYGQLDEDSGKMRLSEPSTKLDAVMDIIHSTGAQIVVFSQFAQVIKLLQKRLESSKISHGIYIGETSTEDRAKIEEEFQNGNLQVFAGTISAGGVGITLTAASTVVFVDQSWSASLNNQAVDRLHRYGQKNAVQVIYINSRNTIDAKRIEQINLKWSWVRKLLGDSVDEEDEEW